MQSISNTKSADMIGATVERPGALDINIAAPYFEFACEQWRDGKKIDEWISRNQVTAEGAKDLLDKYFAGSTYTAAWYCGLISGTSYTTTPATTNTAANLSGTGNGWTECSATYAPNYSTPTGTNRAALASWSAASGAGPVDKAHSATADFTMSATGTVKGAFIATNGTRLNATGVLYSASLFGDKSVNANDIIKVSVTIRQTI